MESQSISKKGKTDSHGDLLSDLPLEIIHKILALVPIRLAIRTAELSRHWRYIPARLPWIIIEAHKSKVNDADSKHIYGKRVNNFVTRALSFHRGPIHTFKLSVTYLESCPDIGHWLFRLSETDIKELFISTDDCCLSWFELHSNLYSCRTLTTLELIKCYMNIPPPTFKEFLYLRSLVLRGCCVVDPVGLQTIVDNSPLLESLTLDDIYSIDADFYVSASAPNLKYFNFQSTNFVEVCLDAPLLAKMHIKYVYTVAPEDSIKDLVEDSVCNYNDFLGDFTNLEELYGFRDFTTYLSVGIESCHNSLVFHHLNVIHLEVNFQDINEISVVIRLIMDAPKLHKLTILSASRNTGVDASEAPGKSFSDFGCSPDFKFEKLRVVEISDVLGLRSEMELIDFIVRRSPVLEKIRVKHSSSLQTEGIQYLADKLLMYYRALNEFRNMLD